MSSEKMDRPRGLSRRAWFARAGAGLAAVGGSGMLRVAAQQDSARAVADGLAGARHVGPHANLTVGDVSTDGFDPSAFLTAFDYGTESRLPSGQRLRDYSLVAGDREIEVAPGVFFPAWAYNGQVPGPTIRASEGDRLRVRFRNAGSHPHTIHFHGIHPAAADGVFEVVEPGGEYLYEFDARPAGLHVYHCHTVPLKKHIHKGLYGVFIVDPPGGRLPARELVMLMNGFDTNFDSENEVYAVNTVAFHYMRHPIRIRQGELVRVYLANLTEFDPINSIHLHGTFFRLYRTGTAREPEYTDTVMMAQGERHVLEFAYEHPGRFMFHAHQSEFAELGWSGVFEVEPGVVA